MSLYKFLSLFPNGTHSLAKQKKKSFLINGFIFHMKKFNFQDLSKEIAFEQKGKKFQGNGEIS